MAFEIPKQLYSGKIREIVLGQGNSAVKVGGENSYSFHLFEGDMPNPPKIAMEVWDCDPSDEWPEAALEPFKDVVSSPDAWARKCVEEYGADIIVLQLKSTDPNGMDGSAEEAAKTAKKVLDAISVPLVVWGTTNNQKDEEVLKKISEACEGNNLALAPVEEGNHKGIGASALGYNHTIIASSPIDVNLAKQLNVLLGNLGVQSDKILIDPTTGGLGYGLEYSYSVMERIRMAALTQEDEKLQMAMISNIGNEIWKCKEAGQPIEEGPALGDPERRGILMEAVAAVSYIMAGSDIVILRHPESVRLARSFVELMIKGGMAADIGGIVKNLESQEIDLISISPEPDLAIAKEETQAEKKTVGQQTRKEAPGLKNKTLEKPKQEVTVKEVPKPEKKKPEATTIFKPEKKAVEPEPEQGGALEVAKKTKEETEKRAEAEEEARKKAEEKAKSKAKAKEKEGLQALRHRALNRESLEVEREAPEAKKTTKTAATAQPSLVDKLMEDLDRIHRRV